MRNFDVCFLAYLHLTHESIAGQGFSELSHDFI